MTRRDTKLTKESQMTKLKLVWKKLCGWYALAPKWLVALAAFGLGWIGSLVL